MHWPKLWVSHEKVGRSYGHMKVMCHLAGFVWLSFPGQDAVLDSPFHSAWDWPLCSFRQRPQRLWPEGLLDLPTCTLEILLLPGCLPTKQEQGWTVVHGLHLSKNSPLSVGVLLERWLGRRLAPRQSGTPQSTSSSLSCFTALPYFFVPHALITNWGR